MLDNKGFDLWADGYDKTVGLSDEENTYPFAGYKDVLGTIYKTIMEKPNAVVLDIGFGTGTLTTKLYENGCAIYGQDFSARMIELASEKMLNAHLYQGDFTLGLVEPLLTQNYDFIVATYSLHHLTDEQKVSFLRDLRDHLNPGGQILIGDVAFESRSQLEQCRKDDDDEWDDDEDWDDDDDEDSSYEYGEYDYPATVETVDPVLKYTLRVTLKGIRPPIYRKFSLPSNVSLRFLSKVILDCMGWTDYHLNAFRVGGMSFYPAYQRNPDWEFGNSNNQEDYALSQVLFVKGKSISFEYDFGDGWDHEVKLSSVAQYKEGEERKLCFIKGERACPPEDCGGIWGYSDLLELVARKREGKRISKEDKERLDWYGIDPMTFKDTIDLESIEEMFDDYNYMLMDEGE